jgi:ribosomal protein L25 (general stress protein Ctc)
MTLPTGPDATALTSVREGGARAARSGGSVPAVQYGRTLVQLCLQASALAGYGFAAGGRLPVFSAAAARRSEHVAGGARN